MSHRVRDPNLRVTIAHEAARIVAESGRRDFHAAKRKAADRLGASRRGDLPSNQEIERALADRQRLFHGHRRDAYVLEMLECAARALRLLEPFHPRLAGPLLEGTADENSGLTLHLFAEPAETVAVFLTEHRVPFRTAERRVRYSGERTERVPSYLYADDEVAVALLVFPLSGRREAPLSPVDGRPMKRAGAKALDALVDAHRAGGARP